jgi:hypothetical protein
MSDCHLTRRHPSALDVIRLVVEAFRIDCCQNPVATISEGHLKVVAMQALLSSDVELLEGSAKAAIRKRLGLANGRMTITEVPRRTPEEAVLRSLDKFRAAPVGDAAIKTKQTSADLRVCSPCSLVFEFQTRSIYGTQDTLSWKTLVDDLDRLVLGKADVFVLACDLPIYNSLRGLKLDGRGRKAGLPMDLAQEILPAADTLPFEGVSEVRNLSSSKFGMLRCVGCRTPEVAAVERVILGTWAVEPRPSVDPEREKIRALLSGGLANG